MTTDAEQLYQQALQLHKSGQLQQAEQCYRRVLPCQPDHADAMHLLGALLVQQNGRQQYSEAVKLVQAAIQLVPSSAKYRRSLGVVHESAEKWAAAADAYERALEKQPADIQARMGLARALKRQDRPARAAEEYQAVLRLQPDHPSAHMKLAALLRQLGRHQAAAEHYRRHLQLAPDDSMAAFWLAALTGQQQQQQACPSSLVAKLFDKYADTFDKHLQLQLHYKTPEALMDCLLEAASTSTSNSSSSSTAPAGQKHWFRCADLGCGTGLMGPLLRPHVSQQLVGVDLSAGMVDKARQRPDCYDKLAVDELVAFLQGGSTGGPFDLLVAADVFVYIGDLQPVLEAAASAAADRGAMFAFSTELLGSPASSTAETAGGSSGQQQQDAAGEGEAAAAPGYVLQTTGRYAHSAGYLHRVAAASGWQVVLLRESVIRQNAGRPIWGNLCVLQRGLLVGGQQ